MGNISASGIRLAYSVAQKKRVAAEEHSLTNLGGIHEETHGMLTVGLLTAGTMGFAVPLVGLGTIASVRAEEPSKKIEIVAKDKEWKVSGYALKDAPTEIVVRNEDTVTHGFNSSLFKDVKVNVQGDGYLAKGKSANAYRVDPGTSMILRFEKPSTGTGEGSATYAFWCDLHPQMKGEMFVLSLRGEGGG